MRVLLIHAFPMDASMWAAQQRLDVDVVAPNLPGFGGSPSAGAVMTMEAAAERCLEALGDTPAVVCGLSMGGYVAFELLRQRPDLVAGLVLANTRAEADDAQGREKRLALADRLDAEGSGFLVAEPPPLLGAGAPGWLREQVANTIAAQPASAIAAAARGMAERPDSTALLADIAVPTLVVTSSDDTLIPPEITAKIADGVPGARWATIEGAGHLSNLEAPEAFDELLLAHLERCRQARP